MDYTFDVGSNIASFGFAWLFVKYILPVLFGILLIVIGFIGLKKLAGYLNIDLSDGQNTFLMIIAAGVIILLFLVRL